MKPLKIISLAVFVSLFQVACSSIESVTEVLPDKKADYKKSNIGKALEIPPDLTSSTVQDSLAIPDLAGEQASYSDYRPNSEPGRASVLPTQSNITVERDGDKRWLVLKAEPDQVWPKLREYWIESGFLLKIEDPRIGIMETDWAENRADIKDDFIRNFLKKAVDGLYSAATRDKFRVRLEKGATLGTTELFLSHKGMEEVVQTQSGSSTTTIWQARPSDPELEAEMLNRVMVFFGVEDEKADRLLARKVDTKPRAHLVKDGQGGSSVVLDEEYSRAWRLTGLALDRVGFAVEDRDRSRGLFYVRYSDPYVEAGEEEGLLDNLAFWRSDDSKDKNQYIVYLRTAGENTRIVVLDQEGQPVTNKTAGRILTLVYEQLKK
jgi:outer membrane protein assembly factor BamC